MKIRVTALPPEGLPINSAISCSALNARLQEGRTIDLEFIKDPVVSLLATPLGEVSAEIKGTISGQYLQSCGRCNEPKEQQVSLKIHATLQPFSGSLQDAPDEEGIIYFEGDQADIESYLQELLIVTINPFWSPECNSEGKCLECKKGFAFGDQEQKATLGDIFKKAKVH